MGEELNMGKVSRDTVAEEDNFDDSFNNMHVDNDDINTSFVSRFEDCAKSIYRGSHPSLYAQMKLGF